MTRIVAGSVGGRRIETPKGDGTRPTSDRVRESMFATLESMIGFDHDPGLRVLDLYAGSGALGLEALSRGAAHAVFVESDARAAGVVKRNLATLGLRGSVQRTTVQRFVEGDAGEHDLVFCDPPYARAGEQVTQELAALRLAPDAVVVVERSSRTPDLVWPEGIEAVRDKAYGETRLWYGRRHG
ncbi:MAG: 16S rRNA (guanine(966)-N(2))-methyltransferase RsmD [Aeromicrobium erythreum]